MKRTLFIASIIVVFSMKLFSSVGGPIQPEFASFEPVDVTDLVNLSTGDLTYVIPLGDVKTPDGNGYPVAINYHSGIRNEQQASWVGLGWNINVGAISRIQQGVPDDYHKEKTFAYLYDDGENGWNFNIGGGWGGITGTVGWSEKGFQGVTSIGLSFGRVGVPVGVGYNFQNNAFTVSAGMGFACAEGLTGQFGISLSFSKNAKPSFIGSGSVGFGPSSSKNSLASFSLNSAGAMGVSVLGGRFNAGSMTASKEGVTSYAWSWGLTIPIFNTGAHIDLSYGEWGWYFAQEEDWDMYGYIYSSTGLERVIKTYNPLLVQAMKLTNSNWSYVLADSPEYYTNGNGDLCFSKRGNAQPDPARTDVFYSSKPDKLEYLRYENYSMPAQDHYSITGQGITGTFKPFYYTPTITAYSEEPFVDGIYGELDAERDYVENPFNQEFGQLTPVFRDGLVFKMLSEKSFNMIDDHSLFEYDGSGYFPGHDDLLNIDREDGTEKAGRTFGTLIEPIFGSDNAFKEKLTGFIVTDMQGKTYYYTEPLFNLQQYSFTNSEPTIPDDLTPESQLSYRQDLGAHATTFLLTAITGPDYIKRNLLSPETRFTPPEKFDINDLILPEHGDWGYWVRFNYEYGQEIITDESNMPIIDESSQPQDIVTFPWMDPMWEWKVNDEKNRYSRMYGLREITYLKSMETASEVAYFRTSPRLDGYGLSFNPDYDPDDPSSNPGDYNIFPDMQVRIYATDGNHPFGIDDDNVIPGCGGNYNCGFPEDEEEKKVHWFPCPIWVPKSAYHPQIMICTDDINIDNTNVSELFTITIDDTEGDFDYFTWFNDMLKEGDVVSKLTFTASCLYRSRWYCLGCANDQDEIFDKDKTINIIKGDQESWEVDPNGIIKAFPNTVGKNQYRAVHCEKDDETGEMTLYCVGDEGAKREFGKWKKRIKFSCGDKRWAYKFNTNTVRYKIGFLMVSTWARYGKRNSIAQFTKKLDEISWYSKSEFPYLRGGIDPLGKEVGLVEEAYNIEIEYDDQGNPISPYPLPEAYRKVRFGYNYELAQNSPNSKAEEKGRLTLKSIRIESLTDDKKYITIPPYILNYQGKDIPYKGLDNCDMWGYKPSDDDLEGVVWNLSEILNPSGNRLKISYERDKIKSVQVSLHKMPYLHEPDYSDWPNYSNEFMHGRTPFIIQVVNPGKVIVLNEPVPGDVSPGTFLLIREKGKRVVHGIFRVESLIPSNALELDREVPWKDPDAEEAKVVFLKETPITGGDIRVTQTHVSSYLGYSNSITRYNYPEFGFSEDLPEKAFTEGYKEEDNKVVLPYSTQNTTVMYPVVEVYKLDNEEIPEVKKFGSTKYYFYTFKNKVMINENMVSIIESRDFEGTNDESETIPVRTVINRSGVVGMVDKIEKFNEDGNVVNTLKNTYSFSEEIASERGAVYNSMSNKLPSNNSEQLGIIRERHIQYNLDWLSQYLGQNILDHIISYPFLVSTSNILDNVETKVDYGMFDVHTGAPLLTVEYNTNSDGVEEKRAGLNMPYQFILFENQHSDRVVVETKNQHTLEGGNVIVDITDLEKDISEIVYSDFSETPSLIQKGTANIWQQKEYDGTYNFEDITQNRFFHNSVFNLKENSTFPEDKLVWPYPSTIPLQWQISSTINYVDKYCRLRTKYNALNIPTTIINHAHINVVTSVISNADFMESGAFTCDYGGFLVQYDCMCGEEPPIEAYYFDYDNGWKIGAEDVLPASVLTSEDNHFGNKCIKTENIIGPTCNYKVSKSKNYMLSAWVKVVSGSVKIVADYRNSSNGEIETWPITNDKLDMVSPPYETDSEEKTAAQASDWTYVEVLVNTETKLNADIGYLSVWVGNPDGGIAYVDDIRFYPEDALIETFYYNQELGLPISFVDANNKVNKYRYDCFGKLTEVYNNAGDLLKKAEYYNTRDNIQVLLPEEEKGYCGFLPIKWLAIPSSFVKLYCSIDNGNSWILINDGFDIQTSSNGYEEYIWEIPGLFGNECYIMVEYVPGQEDIPDIKESKGISGKFVIVIGLIKVKKPDAGELSWAGSKCPIEWEYCGAAMDNVTIEYSFDGGITWNPIATGVGNKDSDPRKIEWDLALEIIPEDESRFCIIQVYGNPNGTGDLVTGESEVFYVKRSRSFIRRLITWIRNRLP